MARGLRIARELVLPLDVVTQKLAWLGITGSGKTYGCKRLVEQLLRRRVQVVILDSMGVWPGLRLGKRAFNVAVFGGLYGDIPLEPTAGTLVANVIVDSGRSVVLDVSQMTDADRTRFATAWASRFFQRKKAAPSPVHVVLDECEDFVPENTMRGEEMMLHEFKRLAKQGRAHGIGVSFVSQRPQDISKKALNQTSCVFAFQMTGRHERTAIETWLSSKGFEGKLGNMLPELEVGEPHVWSPTWLRISKRVHILPIESLDSSRTPKVGEKGIHRRKLRHIDLKALQTAMAETLEKAKQEDPKALRDEKKKLESEIARLKRELAVRKEPAPKSVEVEVISDATMMRLEKASTLVRESANVLQGAMARAVSVRAVPKVEAPRAVESRPRRSPEEVPAARKSSEPLSKPDGTVKLGNGGARRMLEALAMTPDGLSLSQLGVRSRIPTRSNTFRTYIGFLKTAKLVEQNGKHARATPLGKAEAGDVQSLPTGRALCDYWLRELGEGGTARMLRALAQAYPHALSRDELGEVVHIPGSSNTFRTYIGKLKTLDLVVGARDEYRLSDELAD